MLVISGLLTLLVISHAGGAGIKGGLHIKSGALNQEQVAQEDIPAPYSIKTGPVFGTKVTSGDADGSIKGVMSKKAPAPTLHHSVKTAVDRTSKTHPVPGLHHAATSPVAQDQVLIDVSGADTSGIKTIKTTASGKTRFSQTDSQVRDPVTRPVVQSIKTVQEPATDSSQGVKTLKTIDTGKTRFSEQDKQQRDPIARPIIQTLQSTVDSTSDSTKTLKTVTRGKTRFSQGDTQVRDPVASPVIQTVKTDKDSYAIQQTVKTSIKTEPSDIRRKTVKSSQKNIESASASSVPASIVESARRNTLRISVPDSELAGIQEISAGIYTAGLGSQGNTGTRQSTSIGNQETVFFNGKEISVGGLQAGQLFDENLQPILSDNAAISGQANIRASPVPQIPQPVRSSGVTQTARVSTLTSNSGTFTRTSSGATRRRQQAVNVPGERVQLRTPARQPTASVAQTGTYGAGLRPQGAAGIRQSTTTGRQETVLFNGKEISVGGLQAGQLFDENLQPILSNNAAVFGQENVRASPVPQIPQPVRSTGVSTLTSSTGTLTRTSSGATRRRQQAVNVPGERVQLRTPARQSTTSVTQTGTYGAGLRPQGAAGIRQSTTTGRQETVLFNGKEISVGGLQAGQLFDENLQPILSNNAAVFGQENVRASPVPQIHQPVRSTGVSTLTSSTGTLTRTSSGATRRRQQAVNVPRERVQLRTPARQPIASVIRTDTSGGVLRSQGAPGIRQSTTAGRQETVLFNGKEISVGGLQAGQLFDENLQPILSNNAAVFGQENVRASPVPQIPQPVRSTGVTQTAGVSTLTSSTGSLTRTTSGATRRRQQAVNVPGERVQLRTPARQPTASVVQTGTYGAGLRSQGAAGIRQSTTTGRQETVLFNGKEISVGGLQAGQLFDENLQPILSDNTAISGQANVRASPVPQIPQPVRSSGVTQTAGVSTLTSNSGTFTRTSSGATRRRQQAVNVPGERVQLRTPARQPTASVAQTGTYGAGLRSQGAAGIRQSTTTGRQETVLFNGKEISVGGLQAGQLFDENLQPILSDKTAISGQANVRASPVPQIPQPVRSTGVTQTAGVSTLTSNSGTFTRTSSGATRRRQQAVNVPGERVQLRAPARQPTASVAQTGTYGAGLRSQGAAGIRQSTTTGRQETVLFNGKEISVGGLQAGQLFDENLQPILSDNTAISGQANVRASPVPQIPQPVRSTGVTQTAGVSTLTSNSGTFTRTSSGATRRRQQAVNVPGERVQLRAPARQPTASVAQTGSYGAGLRSQGAAGIRQSTTTGRQETVLFNGKEISVGGLQAGQLFDENLQPILSDNTAISGQANVRASPVPQIPQPVRSSGATQTAGVSTLTSNSGTFTRTSSGATRRRQQTVTVPGERVQLRTPARQPTASVAQTGTYGAGLRSQGAAGIRQSTTTGRQETVLFNGKEISVGGLQAGQLFDENLQPILSNNAAVFGQENVRASPVPQIPQPVRSTGVSTLTSSTGTLTRTSSGATRRRQQAVNVPRERVQLRTPARQPIASVIRTDTSGAGLRSQGAPGIRQSTTTGRQETVLFNGKEISVGGLQAGQLFDENLQPILSDNAAISGQANVRASPVPQIPQPVRSAGVSTLTSSTGSLTRTTSGATRRRQQAVTVPRERVQLRTPARQPIASVMQTGTYGTGFRPQVSRQSTTTGSQETAFFNGKEINVGGLQAGQLFDENLQPIRSSSISQDIQPIVSSGVRLTSTNLRNTGMSTTGLDTSVSRGSEFGPLDSRRITIDESISSQGGSLSRGSGLQASGLPRIQYSSRPSSSRNTGQSSSLSGILNPRTISNTEFSQDRVEAPFIQEKQDIPVVPQLRVEDIVEQTSYTNPAALKSAQVQETIPFTIPRTPSKPLFTKISQVSQKDIDIPTFQQQVVTGDFSGYLPKASFLPPFNYGVPVSSKYTVKAPIVQEQQKVEQEFV